MFMGCVRCDVFATQNGIRLIVEDSDFTEAMFTQWKDSFIFNLICWSVPRSSLKAGTAGGEYYGFDACERVSERKLSSYLDVMCA